MLRLCKETMMPSYKENSCLAMWLTFFSFTCLVSFKVSSNKSTGKDVDIGMRQTSSVFGWATVVDITDCLSHILSTFLWREQHFWGVRSLLRVILPPFAEDWFFECESFAHDSFLFCFLSEEMDWRVANRRVFSSKGTLLDGALNPSSSLQKILILYKYMPSLTDSTSYYCFCWFYAKWYI